jgi:hypothetical protein
LDENGMAYSSTTKRYYGKFRDSNGELRDVSSLQDMLVQANNIPNSEINKKIDILKQIINYDNDGAYGYKPVALNNIGVLYYNIGDYNNAKTYFQWAVNTAPAYTEAQNNLNLAKNAKRSETIGNLRNLLNAFSGALGTMQGNQSEASGTGYQNESGSYGGTGSGTSSSERVCPSCGGSKKCSTQGWADKYRCHGSGKCQHCNNTGSQRNYGRDNVCSTCRGNRVCTYCKGTGLCSTCNGTGRR